MTAREAIKMLEWGGFRFVRQNGTSHRIYKKDNVMIPVPMHPGDLSPKVEHRIKKAVGLK